MTPAVIFPAVVPTGQASGLTGTPNPPAAPARSFDGYLIQNPCADTACDDCSGVGWVYEGITRGCNAGGIGSGLEAVQNFVVGGTPGQSYRATLHFYGVVGPHYYGEQVTRDAGTTRPQNLDTGADPPPFGYATGNTTLRLSDYATYEIHVVDHTGADVCSYFLNADTQEGRITYVLSFERTINVIGGGRIRVRVHDRNCRMEKNCPGGIMVEPPCSATGCGRGRIVDVSAANPAPTNLNQPGLGNDANQSGEWLLIDVTNVQCGPPPASCAPT